MSKIVYFLRKKREGANFSVEQIFNDLNNHFSSIYNVEQIIVPYVSSGFFKRVANILFSILNQGDVNHITGDINYVALLLNKKRTISTILDLGILHRTSGIKRLLLLTFWFKLPVYRSKWVTVISEATKTDLLRNVKCDASKIKVIYVPISKMFHRVDKEFNADRPTILQIGGAPNKNLRGLIDAVKQINCKLLIIGKISDENINLLKEFKINYVNKVDISQIEVVNSFVEADILFFASTFEGFGMPILEAQAVGRPVITANILSMPEVAGEAALFVDPYNVKQIESAIKEIIKNKRLRENLIEKGFNNIKRFDADYIASRYNELYQDILNVEH